MVEDGYSAVAVEGVTFRSYKAVDLEPNVSLDPFAMRADERVDHHGEVGRRDCQNPAAEDRGRAMGDCSHSRWIGNHCCVWSRPTSRLDPCQRCHPQVQEGERLDARDAFSGQARATLRSAEDLPGVTAADPSGSKGV